MTADMAVWSNSPWQNDAWLPRDPLHLNDQDIPLAELDTLVDRSHWSSGTCSPSLGGSDCSDDLLGDKEDDEDEVDDEVDMGGGLGLWGLDVSEGDIMQQTMMSILGEEAPFSDAEHIVSLETTPTHLTKGHQEKPKMGSLASSQSPQEDSGASTSATESVIPSAPSSPQIHCKQAANSQRRCSGHKRPWTELSTPEQLSIAEELSVSISRQLGLREQLEVISIINPAASVRPADTHFVIELSWLSEAKLQQVRHYLDRHQRSVTVGGANTGGGGHGDSSHSTAPHHRPQGRVTKRSKRRSPKAMRHRDHKEDRQVKKEARSGLFQHEQVVALSNCEPESSDEEIDILS